MDEVEQHTTGFMPLIGIAEISGFLAVILTGIWMGHFRGGFAWNGADPNGKVDTSHQFNWHPMLLVLGLIFLYGNGLLLYRMISNYIVTLIRSPRRNWSPLGMLTYRLFRNERKKKLKLVHMGIMLTTFLFTVIGLKAVFDSHNLAATPIANLYSLHSWVGIITVFLFACQWVAGFVTFLFPRLASHLRASYMPIHTSFGVMIFILACATALMGITEKLIFAFKEGEYEKRNPEGVMANWIGILIILFGVIVVYITTNMKFKRLHQPEDEMLLIETNIQE